MKDAQKTLLRPGSMGADPIKQFAEWFQDAEQAEIMRPNAMTLATSNRQGSDSTTGCVIGVTRGALGDSAVGSIDQGALDFECPLGLSMMRDSRTISSDVFARDLFEQCFEDFSHHVGRWFEGFVSFFLPFRWATFISLFREIEVRLKFTH